MLKALRIKNKGQSAIEYSVILIVLMGAFLASANYFKRGVQGRWKESTDSLGDQYDPRTSNGLIIHRLISNQATALTAISTPQGLQTTRQDQTNSLELRSGSINVGAY